MVIPVHYWHEPTREGLRELFDPVTTVTGWPTIYQHLYDKDLHSWRCIGVLSRCSARFYLPHFKE